MVQTTTDMFKRRGGTPFRRAVRNLADLEVAITRKKKGKLEKHTNTSNKYFKQILQLLLSHKVNLLGAQQFVCSFVVDNCGKLFMFESTDSPHLARIRLNKGREKNCFRILLPLGGVFGVCGKT